MKQILAVAILMAAAASVHAQESPVVRLTLSPYEAQMVLNGLGALQRETGALAQRLAMDSQQQLSPADKAEAPPEEKPE